MRALSILVATTLLLLSCGEADPKTGEAEPQPSDAGADSDADAEFFGCNNTFVMCPEGYSETTCEPGIDTCINGLAGQCAEPGTCDCTPCFDYEVESCDGDPNCDAVASCDTTKFCTTCPSLGDGCEEGERARLLCPDGMDCTQVTCAERSDLVYFCFTP